MICKKTIGVYWENAMERAQKCNKEAIEVLYRLYPYEKYVDLCFKRIIGKFRIYRNSYLYDECYSVSSQAYMYTISLLSCRTHTEEWIKRYLYKMIRVYIICVLNTCNEVKEICKQNNLSPVDVNSYKV